ncbi:hypothetical protein [Cognaticolwellia mytili]|uniref:hypothetical protein n=1 Tax=Cognaticolwellia mytili TaxID=1888913 RepID=UPI000A16FE00|nr:hypothetical protein [Cognaticolwellia mytili]
MLHSLESEQVNTKFSITLNKLVLLVCLFVVAYFVYGKYAFYKVEQAEASILILTPKVNDIYFLDMRLIGDVLKSKHKYRLAKVVNVTDDTVAIVYGRVTYQWQNAVVNSIKFDDVNNYDYFKLIPDYLSFSKIKEMRNNEAIYLVKRPIKNKIYGGFVN